MRQSSRTLREAMTKKGRCRVFGNGPLTFPRLLDVVADTPIVARTRFAGPRFPEVRGKSKTAEHNAFLGTKPQVAEGQNRGLVGSSRFFPALPEAPARSMRQIPEPPSTPPLSHKETDAAELKTGVWPAML